MLVSTVMEWEPRAGAKAFREAIDACMNDVPLREAAKNSPELTLARLKNGVFMEKITVRDYMQFSKYAV